MFKSARTLSAQIQREIGVRVVVRRVHGLIEVYRAKGDLGCFSHEEALKIEDLCVREGVVPWLGTYRGLPKTDRAVLSFMLKH